MRRLKPQRGTADGKPQENIRDTHRLRAVMLLGAQCTTCSEDPTHREIKLSQEVTLGYWNTLPCCFISQNPLGLSSSWKKGKWHQVSWKLS